MAKPTKLERLNAACNADPSNPFGWYSLAMEQKKTDPKGALEVFERLRTEQPDYLPAYYHHAKTLVESGELERARAIYREGIALARRKNDFHTLAELEQALMESRAG